MLIGIFGTGRNGSTMLCRLLDGLGHTYVHPVEEKFLSYFSDLAQKGTVSRETGQNCTTIQLKGLEVPIPITTLANAYSPSLDALRTLCSQNKVTPDPADRVEIGQLLDGRRYLATDFAAEYLRAAARYACPGNHFEHYLFKSIETPYIDDYAVRFPEMRFIHIIRDPVATCSSQKRTLFEKKSRAASYLGYDWLICMLKKRWIPHARHILAHINDPRHMFLRYEDVVVDPISRIGDVARWLGLSPPPRPDTQTIFFDKDIEVVGSYASKRGVETPAKVSANLRVENRYEEILSGREIDLINFMTGSYQKEFGYQPSSSPTRNQVLAQYMLIDIWELKNVRGWRGIVRGLHGMLYRRANLFRNSSNDI